MRQPDIVLLVLDTQRVDRLSCYGYPQNTTPAIDRLACNSTRFGYAMSAAQWTIPSHASMFTGVYPSIHNTVQSYSVLPATLPTLAERLHAGGYFTAGFCNNPLVGVINNGLRRGFQSFLNYSGLLTSHPNQAGLSSNFIDKYRQGFKRVLSGLLNKSQDIFARSELMLALSFTPLMVPLWQTALSFKGNTAKSLNDAAKLLVDRRGVDSQQPIFCFINLMGTHMPYRPPRRFVQRFAPEVLEDPKARRYLHRFNNDIYGWLSPLTDPLDDRQKRILDGMYDAEVAAQDEQIGFFLEALRDRGQLDNTLIVTTSDHGEHLGEKHLVGHTHALYNELTHVPLIVTDPRGAFAPGSVRDEVVSTRRIFHSILQAAGLASEVEETLDLVRENGETDAVFSQGIPPQNVVSLLQQRKPELMSNRTFGLTSLAAWQGSYKLQTKLESSSVAESEILELYNIIDDPQETLNLRDILPEQVETLHDRLISYSDETVVVEEGDRASNYDDPEVYRRLRDLGYLE